MDDEFAYWDDEEPDEANLEEVKCKHCGYYTLTIFATWSAMLGWICDGCSPLYPELAGVI